MEVWLFSATITSQGDKIENVEALKALKEGKAVARKGWNGKGMFLTLQNGSEVSGNDMRNEIATIEKETN